GPEITSYRDARMASTVATSPGFAPGAAGLAGSWAAARAGATRAAQAMARLQRCRIMGDTSAQGPAEGEDLLGVAHLIVTGEQVLDRLLVDLHLGRAAAQRPPSPDALPLVGPPVRGLDPLDPQGRDGVEVDQDLEAGEPPPRGQGQE